MSYLKIILLVVIYIPLIAQKNVLFSIQAHQDDWQLFMSNSILDASEYDKVVFITLTAGDAGRGVSPFGGATMPYFLAREQGSVYSSKFISDYWGSHPDPVPTLDTALINQHKIIRYNYKNHCINYFLRLPSSKPNGEPYPSTFNKNLKALREHNIHLPSIDLKTTYQGWNDLITTLEQLIKLEQDNNCQVWLVSTHTDPQYNPQDHGDHYSAGFVALELANRLPYLGLIGFNNYSTSSLDNLTNSQKENASAIFATYNWALISNGYVNNFDHSHKNWLAGDSSIIIKSPTGQSSSSCSVDVPDLNPTLQLNLYYKESKLKVLNLHTESMPFKIQLYNLQGQIVQEEEISNPSKSLDLSINSKQTGIVLLKISQKSNVFLYDKLIINP